MSHIIQILKPVSLTNQNYTNKIKTKLNKRKFNCGKTPMVNNKMHLSRFYFGTTHKAVIHQFPILQETSKMYAMISLTNVELFHDGVTQFFQIYQVRKLQIHFNQLKIISIASRFCLNFSRLKG